MFKLYRYFYHKLCLAPAMYHMDERSFDTEQQAKAFVIYTYEKGYTVVPKGHDYIISNSVSEIHCVIVKED